MKLKLSPTAKPYNCLSWVKRFIYLDKVEKTVCFDIRKQKTEYSIFAALILYTLWNLRYVRNTSSVDVVFTMLVYNNFWFPQLKHYPMCKLITLLKYFNKCSYNFAIVANAFINQSKLVSHLFMVKTSNLVTDQWNERISYFLSSNIGPCTSMRNSENMSKLAARASMQ